MLGTRKKTTTIHGGQGVEEEKDLALQSTLINRRFVMEEDLAYPWQVRICP